MSESAEHGAFRRQRGDAKRRGIEFKISFYDWCLWWEKQLGPNWLKKRGRRSHEYVMGRKGDTGSYELRNIICLTMAENVRQANLGKKYSEAQNRARALASMGESNPTAKLTTDDVIKIFISKEKGVVLAKRYKVTSANISCIKRRKSWNCVTKDL